MKPFNLEEALAGKPVVTRDGRKVTELYLFKTAGTNYSLHVCINKSLESYTQEGKFYNTDRESIHDLFMEEPIIERWVNIYHDVKDNTLWIGDIFSNYDDAIHSSRNNQHYIKTIKIDNKPE